jgi:hypothetical protein
VLLDLLKADNAAARLALGQDPDDAETDGSLKDLDG